MAHAIGERAADPLQGIQEVAAELGITMRTMRFYEDKGLIAPQRVGTTRVYTKREVARMRLILRGKQLGFSIREIKEFLDLYEADPAHIEQARRFRGARARSTGRTEPAKDSARTDDRGARTAGTGSARTRPQVRRLAPMSCGRAQSSPSAQLHGLSCSPAASRRSALRTRLRVTHPRAGRRAGGAGRWA